MDRATDRIERRLDEEREALRSNLEELEDRVRSTLDWRRQFRSNTAMLLGIAVGGGLLIGLMTARRPAVSVAPERPTGPGAYGDHRQRELSHGWRGIESALIGVAAAKLKDTLTHIVLGFGDQLARREREDAPVGHRSRQA